MQESGQEGGMEGGMRTVSLDPSTSGPPSLRSLKMVRRAGFIETSTTSFHEALAPVRPVQ